jgi:hypothetical protein
VVEALNDDGRPPFWAAKAERLVGKRVIVGITETEADGTVAGQRQFYGTIEATDPRRGFSIRRADNGELEWLPPDLRAFRPADPGSYTLRASGEVVVDPDFTAAWTLTRQPSG